MNLKLYAHPLSSYCQKALIALYELKLAFDLELLDGSRPEVFAELAQLWPFGKFPVLVDGDQVVPEATVIIEHLDALAGGGRLVPTEPSVRMEMRLMDRVFDNYVATPQQKTVLDLMRAQDCKDPLGVQEAHALLAKSYGWLEGRLSGRTWAAAKASRWPIAERLRCCSMPTGCTRSARNFPRSPPICNACAPAPAAPARSTGPDHTVIWSRAASPRT